MSSRALVLLTKSRKNFHNSSWIALTCIGSRLVHVSSVRCAFLAVADIYAGHMDAVVFGYIITGFEGPTRDLASYKDQIWSTPRQFGKQKCRIDVSRTFSSFAGYTIRMMLNPCYLVSSSFSIYTYSPPAMRVHDYGMQPKALCVVKK